MFHGHVDYFQWPLLGGRPNTKPLGDHGTLNAHNRWFILFYHGWGPAWIEIHWNSIWLRTRSHMTSHYTWRSVNKLHALEVSWGNLWTVPIELSQFHGHGSWLMCEVALSVQCMAYIHNFYKSHQLLNIMYFILMAFELFFTIFLNVKDKTEFQTYVTLESAILSRCCTQWHPRCVLEAIFSTMHMYLTD